LQALPECGRRPASSTADRFRNAVSPVMFGGGLELAVNPHVCNFGTSCPDWSDLPSPFRGAGASI